MSEALPELMGSLLEKYGANKNDIAKFLRSPETQKSFQEINEQQDKETQRQLAEKQKEVLESPFHLESEQRKATEMSHCEPITFNDATFNDLARLFSQLIITVKTTPKLEKDEIKPMTVFIGRSISWLSILQQELGKRLPKDLLFKHVLVSGLRNEPHTETQGLGFKRYLDFLGFAELPKKTPILITDVAETAQSLQRFGELLKQFYNFTNIQYTALMLTDQTLNLERARVIYLTPTLAKIMFAKHEEKAKFCPFSQLYPTQWKDWEKYVKDFQPQKEALELKDQLTKWLGSKQGQEIIDPIVKFANSY